MISKGIFCLGQIWLGVVSYQNNLYSVMNNTPNNENNFQYCMLEATHISCSKLYMVNSPVIKIAMLAVSFVGGAFLH